MTLPELISILKTEHECAPPCSDAQLEAARQRLPESLLAFYAQANGATLHRSRASWDYYTREPNTIQFEFLIPPIDEHFTIAEIGFIDSSAPLYEASQTWRVVCDLADGDYLAIETIGEHRGRVIECNHEETGWPECHIVFAPNFIQALERLLSEQPFIWRDESPNRYGTLAKA